MASLLPEAPLPGAPPETRRPKELRVRPTQYARLRSLLRERRRRRPDAAAVIGFIITAGVILAAAGAPWLAAHDPGEADLDRRLLPPAPLGGDPDHPLGTDPLGRDLLSRTLYGARTSLGIAVLTTTLAMLVGVPSGLIAGYFQGWLDTVWMRVSDIFLTVPTVLLAMALVAVAGRSTLILVVALSLTRWMSFARLARNETLRLREREFVTAARALGAPAGRLMFRHLLPNMGSSLAVLYTSSLTRVIFIESSLAFLGLGIQPPTPTWGAMVEAGRPYLATAWWAAVVPGLAIVIATLGINLVGDWLRDHLDPRFPV